MSWGLPALDDLAATYENCDKCPSLCASRSQVVLGSGSARADIMIIGEAPGEEEDATGAPFMGRAGRLLMNLLVYSDEHIQVWPQDDDLEDILKDERLTAKGNDDRFFEALRDYLDNYIFWCNIICCHPLKNRDPSTLEIRACRDRLERTIYAVDPMLIIGVGKLASTQILGKNVSIKEKRGNIFDIEVPSPVTGDPIRYPMMALLDPAFLLREGSLSLVSKQKGTTWDTLQDLKWAIGLVRKNYEDLFGTEFPHRPAHYKKQETL